MRTPILALLISFAPAAALADVDRYEGICDGSAAVALGPDHFIVANDDEDILKIYRLHEAAAVGEVDVIDFLGNRQPNDEVEEADIEGAARIGDRVYWIASHGRDTDAVVQPTRRVFFATDIVPDGTVLTVKVAGTPYRGLLDDLRGEAKFAPLRLAAAIDADVSPETKGGFNIEGLAATADGQLLIGFRNPLFEGRAIVVTLENPDKLIRGDKAEFGPAFTLDLGGRGIRSIERIGERYVIVAGPFGEGSDFAVYTWSGGDDAPVPIRQTDLNGLSPEALFAFEGSHDAYLLSDDGDVKIDGRKCKKVPVAGKSFRAMPLKLD